MENGLINCTKFQQNVTKLKHKHASNRVRGKNKIFRLAARIICNDFLIAITEIKRRF